jgi:hypothetical protein
VDRVALSGGCFRTACYWIVIPRLQALGFQVLLHGKYLATMAVWRWGRCRSRIMLLGEGNMCLAVPLCVKRIEGRWLR